MNYGNVLLHDFMLDTVALTKPFKYITSIKKSIFMACFVGMCIKLFKSMIYFNQPSARKRETTIRERDYYN